MTGCINIYPVIFIFMVGNYSADYKCDIFDAKSEVMYNRATVITDLRYLSYPVIFVLLIFSLLMAGCSDDENEEQPPAPDVPDYSTLVVKDIQNIPADFTFDRVEVKVTGVDWQVIETLSFPYENGQIVMTLPTSFPSEKLQTVDRRNGMGVTGPEPQMMRTLLWRR